MTAHGNFSESVPTHASSLGQALLLLEMIAPLDERIGSSAFSLY